MSGEYMQDIEYEAAFSRTTRIGGIPVVIGRATRGAGSGPVIFGAALSEADLRAEKCGYGATEAEAAADLFRSMRADLSSPLSGLLGL
jgi:hypothetical protein